MESKEHRNKTIVMLKPKSTNSFSTNVTEIEKEGFDGDNNFIDYFMIIGVKPEIFKNSYLYNSSSIEDININLIPQIITKFPKIDKKHIVIDNTIPQQIFPHGFKAIESETKPENQIYFVILDNQLYSATYTNKYIACLLIYESIKDYEILYEKYQQTDILYKAMRSNSIKNDKTPQSDKYKNYYIPKCLCLVSVNPAFNRLTEILTNIYNLVISNQLNNLYIDRIIEKLVFEIPKLPRGLKKIYLTLPTNSIIDLTEKKMNDLPYININLPHFFSSLDLGNIIDIFRYLLLEIKLIFFGSKLYDLTNSILSILSLIYPFKYQFQIVSVLPKDLYNFIETISPYIFGVNEIYDENFFDKNEISLEDSTILIIDLERNKICIKSNNETPQTNKDFPPLPKNLKEKLEKEYIKYKKELNSKKSEETEDSNKKRDEENIKYRQIFFNFMTSLLKDYPKYLIKDYGVEKDISMSIKEIIDLNSYANSYNANDREFYNKLFSTQMFIEFIYKRMMPKNYYEKVEILFFEEKINELKGKKSAIKSKETAHEYDFDNETINIDCSSKIGITDKVYNYIIQNKDEAEKLFLDNGYDINIDEENKTVNFKYHIFPCLLSDRFFALNYENYKKPELYHNAINEINLKVVNKSNLYFNQKKKKENLTEEGNDVYLCYLIIWSLTIWYTDEWERELRFEQMIEVIERILAHDIQIFELLFKTLVDIKWSDKDIILLYKKFIHLNLNPTWEIFSKVSKIIKKKANVKKKQLLLSQDTKYELLKVNNKKNKVTNPKETKIIRRRSFKSQLEDDKILSEDVIFFAFGKCPKCDKDINLVNLCSDLTHLKAKSKYLNELHKSFKSSNSQIINIKLSSEKEEEKNKKVENNYDDSFKCPFKHKNEDNSDYIKFQLEINHGVELFNSTEKITSDYIKIPLLSPSTIKAELLRIAKTLEEEQKKFDVENFKSNNKILFWNLVWYLQLNSMDISFMIPYMKKIDSHENQNLEKLNSFIVTRKKPEKDINIEKIVHQPDLNIDFLYCNNRYSLEGQNINEIDIKDKIFKNKIKYRYEEYDLVAQKIFKFQINPKKGFISYMSFNNYTDNIGYNEYPTQYKEVPDYTINYSILPKIMESNDSLDKVDIKQESSPELILEKKDLIINDDSDSINVNLNRFNTENLENKESKEKRNALLVRANLSKKNKVLPKKPNNSKIDKVNEEVININKELGINNELKNNENEEFDLLAQFRENKKNLEKNEIIDYKTENINDIPKVKYLRKSTLKEGILDEDNNENNE